MLKVYGIYGQTQAIINFRLNDGAASFTAEFKRGRICVGPQSRPATYTTSNPMVQDIIESSKEFGHLIQLVDVVADQDAKEPETKKTSGLEAKTGITSKEEAISFLKANGAKATQLKDDDAIKKCAAKMGYFFPNLYE